jgi:UDP-glucuronate 4-epimerase
MKSERILVTGAAGFIGASLLFELKDGGHEVLGVDNYSDYYSVGMKRAHVSDLNLSEEIIAGDISNYLEIFGIFDRFRPTVVINLAAQGGVRASRNEPKPYLVDNQVGFYNVLKLCEEFEAKKLLFASSSSVYGDRIDGPFSEDFNLEAPKSLYALSKVANEIMAREYPTNGVQRIGLRFFTVYGPWGRPDMAVFRALAAARLQERFQLTANLSVLRDFTYIDDLTQTILSIVENSRRDCPTTLNISGGSPHSLKKIFDFLEQKGCPIEMDARPTDSLDVRMTHGSNEKLLSAGFHVPEITLFHGLEQTWQWLQDQTIEDIRTWYEYSNF